MADQGTREQWEELYEEAQDLWDEGDYEELEAKLREATDLARAIRSESEEPLAMSLNLLAGVYRETGRDEEALEANLEALDIVKRTREEVDNDVAGCHGNVAQLYVNVGKFSEAIPHFEKAIDLKKRLHGEDSAEIAVPLFGLGLARAGLGDDAGAEQALRQAVDQARRKPGLDELIHATAAYAGWLENRDRHAEIVPVLRESIAAAEKWLSQPAGDFDVFDPEASMSAALRLQYQSHGYGPQALSLLQSKLAELLYDDEPDEALAIQRKVVEAYTSALGEDNPETGDAVLRYAVMLHSSAKDQEDGAGYATAEHHYKQAIRVFGEEPEEFAPDYAEALINLAELYADQGREEEARQQLVLAEEALDDVEDEDAADLEEMIEQVKAQLGDEEG